MIDSVVFRLVLALLLGAFVGLEREVHEKNEKGRNTVSFLGVRTFTLVTVLGTIAGYVYAANPMLFSLITAGFLGLVLAYYTFNSYLSRDIGITTEIALFFSYTIGFLLSVSIFPVQLIVGIAVIMVFILSRKSLIKKYINLVGQAELGSFISYLLIALVILPLLPDHGYTLSDIPFFQQMTSGLGLHLDNFINIEIVNPFKLWRIVALITGVDVFGYILERSLGQKRGWLLTSLAGGFISSTATTQSLALQSVTSKSVNHLVSAALLSNVASFFQEAIILLSLSTVLFARTFPVLLGMIGGGTSVAIYFLWKTKRVSGSALSATRAKIKSDKLFNLRPALKFALLFIFIKLLSQIALQLFGSNGFLVSVGFGSIPGIDAVLVSLAELTGSVLPVNTAVMAFIFANTVNLTTKIIFSFSQGSREFALKFCIGSITIIAAGLSIFLVA